jgi:hypothetical protein
MANKKMGPQTMIGAGMYLLDERRTKVWIPFLQAKIAELQARIEQKQNAGRAGQEAG